VEIRGKKSRVIQHLPQLVDTPVLICSKVLLAREYSNVILNIVIRKSSKLIHFNPVALNSVTR